MGTWLARVVIGAASPRMLARFWAAALGWQAVAGDAGEVVAGPRGDPGGPAGLPLVFVPAGGPKTARSRLHLDVASVSASHQAGQVRRLLGLGARRADIGQGRVAWVVLADPEGNELCVLEPRPVYAGTGPLAAVVAGCAEPAAQARFWAAATGWAPGPQRAGFAALRSPGGAGPFLEFVTVPDPRAATSRIYLDVRPGPGGDQQAEAARLRGLGATLASDPAGEDDPVVLADPEGGRFRVLPAR